MNPGHQLIYSFDFELAIAIDIEIKTFYKFYCSLDDCFDSTVHENVPQLFEPIDYYLWVVTYSVIVDCSRRCGILLNAAAVDINLKQKFAEYFELKLGHVDVV